MKRLIVGILLAVLLVGTVACGASESESTWDVGAPVPMPAPAPAPEKGISTSTPPPAIETSPVSPEGDYSYGENQALSVARMIIRSGDMSLVVVDVADAMEQVVKLAENYDGWVVNSNSWQDGERMMGNIAIRVLADYFDDAISALRGMAVEVRSESTSGVDVTEEYVDLEARLHNLEASEAQLLELMEQAGDVTEILAVQRELVRTRGEIEQTRGRMQYLEESSSTSLIQVRLEQSKLTVEFSASTRNVKEGEKVWFYPEISGGFAPYSYEWDFGDDNTGTNESPYHTYKSDDTYTVKLKVTDDRGNTDEYIREDYIEVLPGWNAGSIASGAWNGMVNFGRVIANIIIWIGIFSPVWIIIGVILYFAWWRKRKKA